jgi:hypothetical protein
MPVPGGVRNQLAAWVRVLRVVSDRLAKSFPDCGVRTIRERKKIARFFVCSGLSISRRLSSTDANKVDTTILPAPGVSFIACYWLIFSITFSSEPTAINPMIGKPVRDRFCAFFGQF